MSCGSGIEHGSGESRMPILRRKRKRCSGGERVERVSRESRMSTLSASLEDVIADGQLPGDKPNGQQLGRAGMEPFHLIFRCDD